MDDFIEKYCDMSEIYVEKKMYQNVLYVFQINTT